MGFAEKLTRLTEAFGLSSRRSIGDLLAIVFLVTAVAYYFAQQLDYAQTRGNQLTEFFDAYSEANGIRGGEAYADHGFTYNKGLQEVSYGTAFDNVGGKYDRNLCPSGPVHCVYLHYPPGPDLVIGAMTKMCGKGQVACFRFAPLFTGLACLAFMAWALAHTIGPKRAAFVLASFYFAPMTTNAMHYLHYLSYVTAFLYVQIGLLMLAFFGARVWGEKRWLIGLLALGFFEGWCSFDTVFHLVFAPLVVWLMRADWRASWKKMVGCTAAVCAGYFVANVMHFWQVAAYLGSWSAAFHDFAARGAARAGGAVEANSTVSSVPNLFLQYWTRLVPLPNFLNFQFIPFLVAIFTALLLRREVRFTLRGDTYRWMPAPSHKWAFVASFVIPNMWLVVMRQHSSVHTHFLPRHFIITFVFGILILSLGLQRVPSEDAPVSAH